MIFLFMSLMALGKDLPGEELYLAPKDVNQSIEIQVDEPRKIGINRRGKRQNGNDRKVYGNLPVEYHSGLARQSTASELVQSPKGSGELLRAIKVGDAIEVRVWHSVIAFPDEKSPVIGTTDSGQFAGFRFIGESYLEKNSKRIFVNFSRLVIGQQIYDLKGVGVSSEGQPGLTGEYHSREAEYFTGDFIASFAAGYFDGLVPRRTSAFGQIETDPSVDSAVKKGLASGALSTADRFREKLKKVPEFSEIKGPFNLKLLVLEQAKTTN